MEIKEIIKNTFSDNEKITLERYKSAKKVLILTSFLFFLNFYFVGAWFYLDFFARSLGYIYILMLFSFLFFTYFGIKKMIINSTKIYFNVIIFIILFSILILLSLPLIIKWWLVWVIDFIKLYLK